MTNDEAVFFYKKNFWENIDGKMNQA